MRHHEPEIQSLAGTVYMAQVKIWEHVAPDRSKRAMMNGSCFVAL